MLQLADRIYILSDGGFLVKRIASMEPRVERGVFYDKKELSHLVQQLLSLLLRFDFFDVGVLGVHLHFLVSNRIVYGCICTNFDEVFLSGL